MTAQGMSTNQVLYLLQNVYFDNIDSGDADLAVEAMHENVEWIHTQVWEHDGHSSADLDTLWGREALRNFLAKRIPEMQLERIEHKVDKVVTDGECGAFRARVVCLDGGAKHFFGWIELKDGKVSSYRVMPQR